MPQNKMFNIKEFENMFENDEFFRNTQKTSISKKSDETISKKSAINLDKTKSLKDEILLTTEQVINEKDWSIFYNIFLNNKPIGIIKKNETYSNKYELKFVPNAEIFLSSTSISTDYSINELIEKIKKQVEKMTEFIYSFEN